MPRSIWKGAISFGLVNIPVGIFTAESQDRVRFRMLDRRTMSAIHEQRLNDRDEPVPQEEIVKGYEYGEGRFVTLTDDDFRRANPKATQTIDIVAFVGAGEIDVTFYDKPYYLAPTKAGRKPYALLRETLRRSGRVAVAKVVIRTRQYLAILAARDDVIVLELLRYPHELRQPADLETPRRRSRGARHQREGTGHGRATGRGHGGDLGPRAVPRRLPRRPAGHDRREGRGRRRAAAPAPEQEPERPGGEVIDIMGLLKRSVQERGEAGETEADGKQDGRKSGGKKATGESPAGEKPARRRGRRTA